MAGVSVRRLGTVPWHTHAGTNVLPRKRLHELSDRFVMGWGAAHPLARRNNAEAEWRDNVTKRLDELTQTQSESAKLQVASAELQVEWSKRMLPSKAAWIFAIVFLVFVAGLVVEGVLGSVQDSGWDSQASVLSVQANEDFLLAIQTNSSDLMRLSHEESVEANSEQSSAETDQIVMQSAVALGSAFLGAVLGWVITQLLVVQRFRRTKRSQAS
jgi:hypothetical protein